LFSIVSEPVPNSDEVPVSEARRINSFSASDVILILQEKGWLMGEPAEKQSEWCLRAAALLGPQVAERSAFAELLGLVFQYDARTILQTTEAHIVMSRYAARDVLRQLALLLLDGAELTTDRFREIITHLKETMDLRGRELFHPLRLALAGRSGEGELDRIILLLDEAAAAGFAAPVKTARERILEFCAAFE
jgi:nondiscriminating glutamyl-tRNA synthetase